MFKDSDDLLFKPRKFLIEKDDNGKYRYRDSLKTKTTGYQWFRKNNSGGKILKIKNHDSRYTISGEYNLGEISALWAVTSSQSDGTRLQDRARERILHRECPSSSTFEEYSKMRRSCYIIEERNDEFYCDCYEGSKGKLCKHSVGMEYFVGNLIAEDDVRAVPLGGKRKRGRPKRNPHCLTRSPGQGDTTDAQDSVGIVNEANDNDVDIDAPALVQPSDGEILPDETHTAGDNIDSVGTEDLCLQLEESFSPSDDDMSVLGADPAFNFKPPKKAKRDVTEVLLASKSRGRGRSSRGRARRGGRGRGSSTTLLNLDGEDCALENQVSCASSSTASASPTSGRSGRGRGRPRGSRGTRGSSGCRGTSSSTSCTSGPSRNKRGRPRGSTKNNHA